MAVLEDLDIKDMNCNYNYTKEQNHFIKTYTEKLGKPLPSCFEDADFLSLFMNTINEKFYFDFVSNTDKFASDDNTADPRFVLMFRRTTPKQEPKPEVFWTREYGTARNGLVNEIPPHSEQRITSKIYVTTLKVLHDNKEDNDSRKLTEQLYGGGSSDGEIRISRVPFPLKENCLFAIKPTNELVELNDFLNKKSFENE